MSLRGSIWASASKLNVTKKPNWIPKLAVYVSLSVIQCYPSSLSWTAGEIRKKEGRTEPTQSLINSRAGLEGLGRRPQSELYVDKLEFGGQRDCWWRGKGLVFGRKKGVARSKMRAIESEVSEMLKGSERNAECSFTWFFDFTMLSILPAKRDLKISTTGGGTPKGEV